MGLLGDVLCAVLCLVTQSCPTLCNPMDCSLPGSSVHRDFPGKNTRVDCHSLLQGIFPTQGLNPDLLNYRLPTKRVVKRPPANAGDIRDMGLIPGWKILWRRAWQPTPVFLSGKSLWTEEPGRLQSMGLQRVGHD